MGGDGAKMPKFFIDDESIKESKIIISGQNVKHIKNVLRLSSGDNIILSNNKDKEYSVKITAVNLDTIETEIITELGLDKEPQIDITLFQGLPKGDKMELIIQKAVEIGIKRIVPVITQRVVVKLDEKNTANKLKRWQKISEEAAKQSGRNMIPEIGEPISFKQLTDELNQYDFVLIPYENEQNRGIKEVLKSLAAKPKTAAIFIGPEGGIAQEEIDLIQGFPTVSLGPRILRTETAGLVAGTILLYEMGEM
jgi:16S rRNA (uracil1498-N3)-methyltransferase